MAVISIVEVALAEMDAEYLLGRNIEAPRPGLKSDAHELEISGWVLGRHSPAVAVEVLFDDAVVRRATLNARRPDIEAAFSDNPHATTSGFRTGVALAGMGEIELSAQAVMEDQSRVALGRIRLRRSWAGEDEREAGAALVSVVISCHDQARFLGEAIESALAQGYPHVEVVVVDDGSTDNALEVARGYPGVRCVQQERRGLAGARNEGIRRSRGSYLVFLDADDRLLDGAVETGLKRLKERPECAFAAGGYRYVAFDGSPLSPPPRTPVEENHYEMLLRNSHVWASAAVMYRRVVFESAGVFDALVGPSADHDLYLRVAREYPVHEHGEVVAECRRQGTNTAREGPGLMLKSEMTVLRRQREFARKNRYKEAYEAGVKHSREHFGEPLATELRAGLRERQWHRVARALSELIQYHPHGLLSALRGILAHKVA